MLPAAITICDRNISIRIYPNSFFGNKTFFRQTANTIFFGIKIFSRHNELLLSGFIQ